MRNVFVFLLMITSFAANAQEKKVIDHTVYNDWKSLKNAKISNDGKYISYEKNPHQGDGYLYIYNTETKRLDSVFRGTGAVFSGESSYLAFKINPGYDTLRTCELKKIKKTKWPKDSLGIYLLKEDSLMKFPKLKSFEMAEKSDWMAVMFDHNELKTPEKKKKKRRKKKKNAVAYTSKGHVLSMYNPASGQKHDIKDVSQFEVSEKGAFIAYTIHRKVKSDSTFLSVFNTSTGAAWVDTRKFTDVGKIVFDEKETQLVYLTSSDSSKVKNYDLYHIDLVHENVSILADSNSTFIPEGDAVSMNYTPRFTKDGKLLYFGVAEELKEEPKDTLLESEKVKLDLWHYADKRLQPQQLLEKRRDEKRTDLYVYHFDREAAVQLSDDTLNVSVEVNLKGNYLVGMSTERFEHTYNWVAPRPADYYRINIETGEAEIIVPENPFGAELSPSGNQYTYFDRKEKQHYLVNISENKKVCMTCGTSAIWTQDMNGMPMDAYPYGVEGWSPEETEVYVQSRYDIWSYSTETGELINMTQAIGDSNKIEMRPNVWSRDSVYFDPENVYIQGFDTKTKGVHFYDLVMHDDHIDVKESAYFDADVMNLMRSENKERVILRKMTFEDYPELYTYTDNMQNLECISNTNPQQGEYNWGTVELVKWKSYKGIELEGLLYKPEDFDPNKEYPLLVYYYELYSDRMHRHYIPKPTASIIYPTEYASAGYVVFIPDIRYEPGHPAKSAYDCIMSGTDYILDLLPNVDSTRMGLQGQSWGGYQTAQLVTMTNRYSAAMAGAPVSNMFSAYGGIRWGSGLNRQFQYERTQSRIGYTIWERPDLYIENSPLFHLPNVTTPLLIMHNDNDGAVPWYQGIELFTGMKRLGKKAWLLNYNDDKHNLMENANRIDLSIRMRQFFDHYLKGEEAPQWMTEGIPAVEKGKELRYE